MELVARFSRGVRRVSCASVAPMLHAMAAAPRRIPGPHLTQHASSCRPIGGVFARSLLQVTAAAATLENNGFTEGASAA